MLYATGRSARRGEASSGAVVAIVAVVVVCLIVIVGSGAFMWYFLTKAPTEVVAQTAGPDELAGPVTPPPGFGPPGTPGKPRPEPGPKVGDTAPEIEGEDLDGTSFKLSDYRGKVIVLDFWAGW